MSKVKIVTDSTIDLPKEIIEAWDIRVVPLSISIDGETYLDGIDLTPQQFIEKMKQANELPKSSQPSAGQFLQVYDELGEAGYDVISIHMTGGMSGTVRSAESAAAMTKTNVTVVDSRFISLALGFQVLEAAKMASEEKTVSEIVSHLDTVRANTHLFVVVDTLENLVKGGRIGRGKAMIGSLLNIKPIASLEDGVYTPVTKVRSQSQIVKYLTNQFVEHTKGKKVRAVGITHADALDLSERLKQSIAETTGWTQTDIVYTTPIISTHTGPGAIGFMYYTE
ncbi:DegV family protein [Anoxybacillus kestanbolensis]|uniref:DegV family protein n=1 Tax=Anoxybacillus kestanbolensis TaxID=227476 RepID=UPI003D257545